MGKSPHLFFIVVVFPIPSKSVNHPPLPHPFPTPQSAPLQFTPLPLFPRLRSISFLPFPLFSSLVTSHQGSSSCPISFILFFLFFYRPIQCQFGCWWVVRSLLLAMIWFFFFLSCPMPILAVLGCLVCCSNRSFCWLLFCQLLSVEK